MNNQKIKNSKQKSIKIFNKSINRFTKTIKEPIEHIISQGSENENTITDYGNNQIKQKTKKIEQKTLNYGKSILKTSYKIPQIVSHSTQIKKLKRNIIYKIKNRKSFKNLKILSSTVSRIKDIIKMFKSLITFIYSFSIIAIFILIFLCLIGLFCSSPFGIFFSSSKENNTKISEYIIELNNEMDNKIKQIETSITHDDVVIESDKAEWKDILILYSIKTSEDNLEVLTLDQNKKDILREIFWDMNSLSHKVIKETYNVNEKIENMETVESDYQDSITKNILHIYIKKRSLNEMKKKYNFSNTQIARCNELSNKKNDSLWNMAIYGVYSNSSSSEWKQTDPQWSTIKIGRTSKSIGEIGCLVTSIAILIEKSGVPVDIKPFNPGTFVLALNNSYGFDNQGNLKYATITNIVPKFKFQGFRILRGKTKMEKYNEIKKYYSKGYSIAIEVKGATSDSQHWVALNEVTENDILMFDPSSNETNLWNKYNWENTSQFIYFTNF